MDAQTATTATRLAKARARRRPGTMWQVLEWAYRSEMVRFAFDDDIRPHRQDYGGRSMTGLVCDRLETGIISFGVSHPKGSAADADALAVDYLVETLPREDYWLVVNASERGVPPPVAPEAMEHAVVEPVLKANGRPRMIVCPIQRRPVACRVQVRGYTPDEIAAATRKCRESYERFVHLLTVLRDRLVADDHLTRWELTAIGVPAAPWTEGC